LTAILIHYPSEMHGKGVKRSSTTVGSPKQFSIHLSGLKAKSEFTVEIVDQTHANAIESWKKMGSPEPPSREQIKKLKTEAENPYKETVEADKKGNLIWNKTLDPWACVLFKQL
jgi:xylan 1,4-beta-xylosidase